MVKRWYQDLKGVSLWITDL